MEIDIREALREVVLGVAETRGVENIRLVHSILVECCNYLTKRDGRDVLSEMKQLVQEPYDEEFIRKKDYLFAFTYYDLRKNIFHEIDPPDAPLNMQAELPCGIDENFRMGGATIWEAYDVITRGVKNVDLNPLWPIYKNNEHVIAEGYSVEQN
jgi:hypothetical protein